VSQDKVVDLFDDVAEDYDTVMPFFAALARSIAAGLDLRPGMRVLDLGCGTGAITTQALARGCTVTAIDAAASMVDRLRARHPQADAQVMDAHRLAFPNNAFDAVVSAFVMHLLHDPVAAAREVHRTLTPGGWFALALPGPPADAAEPPDITIGLFEEFAQYLPPNGGIGHPLDGSEVLAAAGFTDISRFPVDLRLDVPDAATLWRWLNTHGTKAFLDDLPPERRTQFHDALVRGVGPSGTALRRGAVVHTGRS
jgi:SAM-dependent methyltransferase